MLAVFDLRPFGFTIVGAFSATSIFGCYSWKHQCTCSDAHRGGEAEDGSTIKGGWVGGWVGTHGSIRVTSMFNHVTGFSEVIC